MNATTTEQRRYYHSVLYCEAEGRTFYGVCAQCGQDCMAKPKVNGSSSHWSAYSQANQSNSNHPKRCTPLAR
jgi:hypothetical protein